MKRFFLCYLALFWAGWIEAQQSFIQFTVAQGLANNQIRQLFELPNGQILVGTEGVFSLFNGQRFITLDCRLDSVRRLPAFGSYGLLNQGDTLLWLKDYYWLYLFDMRTRMFRYDYERYDNDRQLQCFISEKGDSLTHANLKRLEPLQPHFDSIVSGTPLSHDQLRAYVRDRQGGEWFGTQSSGIIYQPPTAKGVRLVSPLPDDVIRHIQPVGQQFLLMGGQHGIYLFDCANESVTQTLATGEIHCANMTRDNEGRIWVATFQGIYCYDHGTLHHYDHTNTTGFIHDHIRFALPLDGQRLLVCNLMHHLSYFYPNEWRMQMINSLQPTLSGYRTMIAATLLGNRNKVAVCTQNGLFVLDVTHDQLEKLPLMEQTGRYSQKFNCILLDRTGRLWIGTQNGLLVIYNGALRRFTHADGLSNECIQGLVEDASGSLWVSTANGINRLRIGTTLNDVHIRVFDCYDGIPESESIERGICMMPDSTLYVATSLGLVLLDTKALNNESQPQKLVIVGLDVADQPMPLDTLPLRLTYKQNYINIQVSALNYAHPLQTRYRYRLLGSNDNAWHPTLNDDGMKASIRLSALPPGNYTLEIQASTGDDVWGLPLRKSFIITPPLWLTWWAKAFYAIFGLIGILVLISLYLRYRQRKLERENEERVNRLFELRQQARHQFAEAVNVQPEKITVGSEEEQLVELIMKAIGDHIDDTEYTIDLLARDIGMSRANLYKKMQAMLGITPNDFIRNVRLKRAAQLLADTDLPVNQIALMVGFQTPRYFSQCFRSLFGVTPSEYRAPNS